MCPVKDDCAYLLVDLGRAFFFAAATFPLALGVARGNKGAPLIKEICTVSGIVKCNCGTEKSERCTAIVVYIQMEPKL